MWIPRYLAVLVVWRLWLCMVYVDWMMLRLLVMCMVWHFCGWKCMSQSDSHRCRASRSSWRAFESSCLVMPDGVVNYGVVSKVLQLSCFEYRGHSSVT